MTTLNGTNGTNSSRAVGRPPNASQVLLQPGLSIWRGTIAEEYLTDLKPWSKAVKVLKEMEDDVVIGALYESVSAPLKDAKFHMIPASDSQADKDFSEFVRMNTINSETEGTGISWIEHVEEALEFMTFGFSITEKVLEKGPESKLWLSDLMPIGQETLLKWGDVDKHGRVTAFTQQIVIGGKVATRTAPMSKLLHFTFRGRKRNPMGRSLSRNLYRPWFFKKNLEVVEAIGAERDVGNVPVAVLGEGAYSDADQLALKKALEGFRIDETAFLIVPHGTEIRPFGAGGKVYDIRTIIRDYQHLIRQRFFMDFISLGSEQVGTQALAKEVTGFFSLALGSIQRELLRVWNQQLIPYLWEWNKLHFPDITSMPLLTWSKPGKINIQSLAQSTTTLLGTNAIHWTPELEHHLRDVFELPPIDDTELARLQAKDEQMLQQQLSPAGPNGPNGEKGSVPGDGSKSKVSGTIN